VLTRRVHSSAEATAFRADAAAQGDVIAFAADGTVHALTQTPTWGFTDATFPTAWTEPTASTGTGIRVAILDTGVDATHPDLTGHFDLPAMMPDMVNSSDLNNPTLVPDSDPHGHGTHVSGIVAATDNTQGVVGGAPGVTLVPVRVLNSVGNGSYSNVAAGILWAADVSKGNARVISMSLGGSDDGGTVGAALATIEDPTNAQYTHPVVVIAAGNTGCATPSYPAIYAGTNPYQPVTAPHTGFRQVLTVSAVCKPGTTGSCPTANPFPTDAYRLATFSSLAWNGSGAATGITAPGVEINSTWPGGTYNVLSGTSMATPFVAAAAALVFAHCSADTSTQVVARLENSADDLGPVGPDKLYGFGMLDADNAVKGC
jgi:subtilisin family serine protease